MARIPHKRKKDSPIYWTWQNMKRRCSSPKASMAERYLGRGITYTDKWETFEGFCADMESTYKKGLSIERINNDGNYEPGNCRWATMKEQCNNRGNSRIFTHNGETKTLAQWCEIVDVKPSTVRQRFYGLGWDIEKALFMPTGEYKR